MATEILSLTFARGTPAWTPQVTFNEISVVQKFTDLLANDRLSWTGPLPDIVLAPLSYVQLFVARGGDVGNNMTVSNITLTLTRMAPGQASIVQVEPLWLPVPVEPPDGAP